MMDTLLMTGGREGGGGAGELRGGERGAELALWPNCERHSFV